MDFKRKLIILVVPAVLAVSGGAMVVAHAATSTTPGAGQTTDTTGTAKEAPDPTEATDTIEATDQSEASGAPEVGHTDTGAQADHQFDGQE